TAIGRVVQRIAAVSHDVAGERRPVREGERIPSGAGRQVADLAERHLAAIRTAAKRTAVVAAQGKAVAGIRAYERITGAVAKDGQRRRGRRSEHGKRGSPRASVDR